MQKITIYLRVNDAKAIHIDEFNQTLSSSNTPAITRGVKCDLVLKLYRKTEELLKIATFAEVALVYGNRYRSSYEGLSNKLNLSEQLFLKGEYQKSLELTITLLNKIETGIYEKLVYMYNLNS